MFLRLAAVAAPAAAVQTQTTLLFAVVANSQTIHQSALAEYLIRKGFHCSVFVAGKSQYSC